MLGRSLDVIDLTDDTVPELLLVKWIKPLFPVRFIKLFVVFKIFSPTL